MPDSLDDIFNDDSLGLLNPKEKESGPKSDEDRMIDSFEEINAFFEKNNREPATRSMSEYNLQARLKGFRNDEGKKRVLKPFDRFNLLGHVEIQLKSLDEVLDDDDGGLLDTDADTSIFDFKHTPCNVKRSTADYISHREPINEEEFSLYEKMFRQVHAELKDGKRRLRKFDRFDDNLQVGNFYLLDGMLLYLKSADLQKEIRKLKSGNRERTDGRTDTIFENGTRSNMLFRSLGKAIQKNGKLVTVPDEIGGIVYEPLISNVTEEDIESGWIYVLKSKSTNPQIVAIPDLYKIGFSKTKVEERIKNAANEATYLFADVGVVTTYHCYNINIQQLENLTHRFFAEACLNIDVFDSGGMRYLPREWFCVPLEQIDQAIGLMRSGEILNYRFDKINNKITEK